MRELREAAASAERRKVRQTAEENMLSNWRRTFDWRKVVECRKMLILPLKRAIGALHIPVRTWFSLDLKQFHIQNAHPYVRPLTPSRSKH